jgi:hypothetical protein
LLALFALPAAQPGLRAATAGEIPAQEVRATEVTANEQDTPSAGPSGDASADPGAGIVLIRADQQVVDNAGGLVVASGNVEARFQGWRLLADRIEFREGSRSVWAMGQVRLLKGDQYLQASSLRYSDWEGSGQLLDVYGVIDSDSLPDAIAGIGPASDEPAPAFACPPLSSDPDRDRLLEILPPGRKPQPTIAAPPGCPGYQSGVPRRRALADLLSEAALGSPAAPTAEITPVLEVPDADTQRVRDVRYRQSLEAAVKLSLASVSDNTGNEAIIGQRYRPPSGQKGTLSRLRFQTSRLQLEGNRWRADEIAFTNDPFTPANVWTIARAVEAETDAATGITRIRSRSTRIILDDRVAIPAFTSATLGEEEARLAIETDRQDRDGFYLGYNLTPIRLGERGQLQLQPQFMVQRAIEGKTNSFVRPDSSINSPRVDQGITAGDLFGLDAQLNLPVAGASLNADVSLATLNPENLPSGTRGLANLSRPLGLSWLPTGSGGLFAGYRERIFNGSLGEQDVIYSYGARIGANHSVSLPTGDHRPVFRPLAVGWTMQSGNYQANRFETDQLATLWRTNLLAQASTGVRLWQAEPSPVSDSNNGGLRYAPVPIVPSLDLQFGLAGNLTVYSDGSNQNLLTLWGGPALTLGRLERPLFDYTRLAVSVGGTIRDGLSPFGFDRAVDLQTISFTATQQIYGPLVLQGGASFNIDRNSEFFGDASYGYVELTLQRRSYELGIYYSPYDGIGGIRIRLNDFSFSGTGSPFVPRPAEPPLRPGVGLSRR